VSKILGLKILSLTVLMASPLIAQSQAATDGLPALQRQIDDLKESQRAIQSQLDEIKRLLLGTPGAQAPELSNVTISLNGHPSKGSREAKLILVDFSDYQCPFCGRFFAESLPHIERDFIATGKLRYVFRDFPLEMIHSEAFKAHEAAGCAGDQEKYWEMHDRLFQNQQQMQPDDLARHAAAIGINPGIFQSCLSSRKHAATIRKNMDEGKRAGVQGTPTLFLGVQNDENRDMKVFDVIRGAQPYLQVKKMIERALQAQVKW